MRGIYTSVTDIRRRVFTEIARLSYANGDLSSELPKLPYKILPGEVSKYRDSIFLERAIISERLRLSLGLPLRPVAQQCPVNEGVEASDCAEKYYEPPLVNVIKFACNACPEKKVVVTDICQGCLAHPCSEVCPKGAISFLHGKSIIDQDKCIKCGLCVTACSYRAIVKMERPCSSSCGMDAISSDELGRAEIDQSKCVSCGQCIVNCPFGAISDKGQIYQVIQALQKPDQNVYAAVAPAFVSQFGADMTAEKLRSAIRQLGFTDMVEVAIGADLCSIEEAKDFLREVPEHQPFMATSCCPAWSVMAKKLFPQFEPYISMAMTPMVLTARLIKMRHKNCRVVFVGPCAAKKLEASRRTIRSDVDFVLTFEEIMAMFDARGVDFSALEPDTSVHEGTGAGRNFAVSGGVAKAVVEVCKRLEPEREVSVMSAQGLRDCRRMLTMAKTGKYDGCLLEGMACPGGCVAGAGTIANPEKAAAAIAKYKNEASTDCALDSKYDITLPFLHE